MKKWLVRYEPADAGFRIHRQVEVLSKRAVVVEPEGAGEEEPLAASPISSSTKRPDGARLDGLARLLSVVAAPAMECLVWNEPTAGDERPGRREIAKELSADRGLGSRVPDESRGGRRWRPD